MKTMKALALAGISLSAVVGLTSDHDDGVSPMKNQAKNVTDVFAFREDNQTGNEADRGNLILAMNSNPRSLARQQYYFSTDASYEFHLTRVTAEGKNETPTGEDDVVVRVRFGEPDVAQWQPMTVTLERDGQVIEVDQAAGGGPIQTTNLADAESPHINAVSVGGQEMTVFAGLREDPFFFDVEQFFRVRAGAAGLGPKVGFKKTTQAVDFTSGYNVNSIVLRLPIALLQSSAQEPIFDVWTTVSVNGEQIERLARPALNEGLVLSNESLNAFNSIPPSADLSDAAAPVRAEVAAVLDAADLIDEKDDLTVEAVAGAFLPDVMRIDTNVDIPVGKTAYNADLSGDKGILTGGRKLEDDVMDITLSFVVAGDATGEAVKDGVSYAGKRGNQAQRGHQLLSGQTDRLGPATFPFLALPN